MEFFVDNNKYVFIWFAKLAKLLIFLWFENRSKKCVDENIPSAHANIPITVAINSSKLKEEHELGFF